MTGVLLCMKHLQIIKVCAYREYIVTMFSSLDSAKTLLGAPEEITLTISPSTPDLLDAGFIDYSSTKYDHLEGNQSTHLCPVKIP